MRIVPASVCLTLLLWMGPVHSETPETDALPVLVVETGDSVKLEAGGDPFSPSSSVLRQVSRIQNVSPQVVADNLKKLLASLDNIFDQSLAAAEEFDVDVVELHLNIDASGGVSLIGSVNVGVSSGIKLVLKRKAPGQP